MTINDKKTIWNLIEKYDNTLTDMCNSLSNILTGKNTSEDYINIFSNYRNISIKDEASIDDIIGDKVMLALN